jgi:hypothetical protein
MRARISTGRESSLTLRGSFFGLRGLGCTELDPGEYVTDGRSDTNEVGLFEAEMKKAAAGAGAGRWAAGRTEGVLMSVSTPSLSVPIKEESPC